MLQTTHRPIPQERLHPTTLRLACTALLALTICTAGVPALGADGPRQTLADGLVTLNLPVNKWKLKTTELEPPTIATIDLGGGNRARFALQPAMGISFDYLVTILEGSIASRYADYEVIDSTVSTIAERQVLRTEGTFSDEGADWQAVAIFTLTEDGRLFSFSFRVHPDELDGLRSRLEDLMASLEVEDRPVVELAGS